MTSIQKKISPSVQQALEEVQRRTKDTANEFPYGRTTLQQLLKKLGFKFLINQGNRLLLMEKYNIQNWRLNYLFNIKLFRNQGRTIIYLDETWFNVCDAKRRILTDGTKESTLSNPTGKGERLMIIGAGGEAGWVESSFLVLRTRKTGSADYRKDMDCHNFEKWFGEKLIPNLRAPSVILMDNASYHCRKLMSA